MVSRLPYCIRMALFYLGLNIDATVFGSKSSASIRQRATLNKGACFCRNTVERFELNGLRDTARKQQPRVCLLSLLSLRVTSFVDLSFGFYSSRGLLLSNSPPAGPFVGKVALQCRGH
jgi:hypothetical protein